MHDSQGEMQDGIMLDVVLSEMASESEKQSIAVEGMKAVKD
jgi:hypothetical protein